MNVFTYILNLQKSAVYTRNVMLKVVNFKICFAGIFEEVQVVMRRAFF